jgi:outer membrane protein OmpA-like peptidoglycan-associated protein
MNDQEDESRRYGLILITVLVALVVAGVVGLGVAKSRHRPPATAAAVPAREVVQTDFKLYFQTGSATLPPDAQRALGPAADVARARPGTAVVVSGFHDASGDAAANAELAKERALAVRHALEANGVEARAIVLSKPQLTLGGSDPKEARRVEIHVR